MWIFITIVWNNKQYNLAIRQQRLNGNLLPAASVSGDGKFLKNSSKNFQKKVYVCVCVFVYVCLDVKCNRL